MADSSTATTNEAMNDLVAQTFIGPTPAEMSGLPRSALRMPLAVEEMGQRFAAEIDPTAIQFGLSGLALSAAIHRSMGHYVGSFGARSYYGLGRLSGSRAMYFVSLVNTAHAPLPDYLTAPQAFYALLEDGRARFGAVAIDGSYPGTNCGYNVYFMPAGVSRSQLTIGDGASGASLGEAIARAWLMARHNQAKGLSAFADQGGPHVAHRP